MYTVLAAKSITYKADGSINNKFDVGTYKYTNNNHAVSGIENLATGYAPQTFDLEHTSFNRTSEIELNGQRMIFSYGPDKQRNVSRYYASAGATVPQTTRYYNGTYEKEVTGSTTKEYDYIYSPEGLAAIAVKTGGTRSLFYTHTDHLGSLRTVTGADKTIKAQYSYDAWGVRTPESTNTMSFTRGFTGHEHLDDFGLINMNARMYDPVLGRFLSVDPYVQMPDYTQSFNRYSYALNNPLIYTDPSGEFIFTILAAIFAPPLIPAAFQLDASWMMGGFQEMANGGNFWAGAGKGLVTGAMNAGLSFLNVPGMIPNGLLHAGGNVLSNGITNAMYGKDFWQGAGWQAGLGFAGGAYSGYQLAKDRGLNLWTGIGRFDLTQGYAASGTPLPEGKKTITGRYVGKIEDVNVYESKLLGSYADGSYSGVTIPERGIIVGKGVYKGDWDMMRHEFGHILQYRKWGGNIYWSDIAPTSLMSVSKYGTNHKNTWTEWSANYLSYYYFGQPANWDMYSNPIWPTVTRPGILPPFVRGPFDFKFNWLDN